MGTSVTSCHFLMLLYIFHTTDKSDSIFPVKVNLTTVSPERHN